MLKKIALVITAAIALLMIVIALQPSDFKIERSTSIKAPAPVVYALLSDFKAWRSWSPWEGLDPNLKRSYEGAPQGKGAAYHWVGNENAGEGRMEISDARENQQVTIELHFLKPFEARNTTLFTIAPGADTVTLNWSMRGKNDFMGKAFSLFMNMDKLVGADFERGLANIKREAEAKAKSGS